MHYHAEIWVPTLENLDQQIEDLMEPHRENDQGSGFWDWYQIGGRWTGSHDNYDPTNDRANYEKCFLCNGTGFRDDALGQKAREKSPSYTCNACGTFDGATKKWGYGIFGPGLALKFQSHWVRREAEAVPVESITDSLSCYVLIIGERVFMQKIWDGQNYVPTGFDGNVKSFLEKHKIQSGYLVTVDYHC